MTKIKITVPGIFRIQGRNTDCAVGDIVMATHRESHALVNGGYAEHVQKTTPQRSESETKRQQRNKTK